MLVALSELMCLSQCAQGDSGKRLKYHLLGGGAGGAASNAAQPPANGPPVRLTLADHCCCAVNILDVQSPPWTQGRVCGPFAHMNETMAARPCVRCMAPCAVHFCIKACKPCGWLLGAHNSLPDPGAAVSVQDCVTVQRAPGCQESLAILKAPCSSTGAGGQQRQRQPGAGRRRRRGLAAGPPAGSEAHRRPPRVEGPGGPLRDPGCRTFPCCLWTEMHCTRGRTPASGDVTAGGSRCSPKDAGSWLCASSGPAAGSPAAGPVQSSPVQAPACMQTCTARRLSANRALS